MAETSSSSNLQNQDQDNTKYLGIISSINHSKNLIILSDFPKNLPNIDSRFKIQIGFSKNFAQEFLAENMQNQKRFLQIKLVDNISTTPVEFFIRKAVFTENDNLIQKNPDLVLPEDILGLNIFNIANNELIGTVKDVLINPANQIWVVENDIFELPIPFSPNVVKKVNMKEHSAYIELIEGLMDLAIPKIKPPKKERVFKKRGAYGKKAEIEKEK
jgi:ribosomal 30S subunit maturation factor RimM